jgi:hypothetical protein
MAGHEEMSSIEMIRDRTVMIGIRHESIFRRIGGGGKAEC